MANRDLGSFDLALTAEGAAPEWEHLFPAGKMTGRDGRKFELADAAGLVLAFQSAAVDLPIGLEHQNDRPEAKRNGPAPRGGLDQGTEGHGGRALGPRGMNGHGKR